MKIRIQNKGKIQRKKNKVINREKNTTPFLTVVSEGFEGRKNQTKNSEKNKKTKTKTKKITEGKPQEIACLKS